VQMPPAAMSTIEQAWVDLATILKTSLSRNELAAVMIIEVMQVLSEYPQVGLNKWLLDWQRFDQIYGKKVKLSTPFGETNGIAQGIDENGALRVQTSQGLQYYGYGEVSVR